MAKKEAKNLGYTMYNDRNRQVLGVLFDMDGMVVEHYGASGG